MSRFYFTMNAGKSNSGTVTRRCHGRTAPDEFAGRTVCASWKGAIQCVPYVGADDRDMVRIESMPWKGSKTPRVVIYDGPMDMAGPFATDLK